MYIRVDLPDADRAEVEEWARKIVALAMALHATNHVLVSLQDVPVTDAQ